MPLYDRRDRLDVHRLGRWWRHTRQMIIDHKNWRSYLEQAKLVHRKLDGCAEGAQCLVVTVAPNLAEVVVDSRVIVTTDHGRAHVIRRLARALLNEPAKPAANNSPMVAAAPSGRPRRRVLASE
jgi:hypothetical protein